MFGPEGKKNRKAIKGWAVKMKGELIEKFEQAKEITEPVYHAIVDQVSAKYAKQKDVSEEELSKLVAEVRKHWKSMASDAKPAVKKAKKAVAKVRTASKSAAKKIKK